MQCTQRKAAIKTFGPKAAAKLKRARSSSQNIKKTTTENEQTCHGQE